MSLLAGNITSCELNTSVDLLKFEFLLKVPIQFLKKEKKTISNF